MFPSLIPPSDLNQLLVRVFKTTLNIVACQATHLGSESSKALQHVPRLWHMLSPIGY